MHRPRFVPLVVLVVTLLATTNVGATPRTRSASTVHLAQHQAPAWISSLEQHGLRYFLFAAAPRIERYDLQAQTWLDPLPLRDVPTAFTVDGDGIYVSFGRRTARFTTDGLNETHLRNTTYDVDALFTLGDNLYIHFGSTVMSVNKTSGALIDSEDYWYDLAGLSLAPTKGKLFGRSVGVSPSDIVQIVLNNDGTLGPQTDSPYHGDYPGGSKTFVFPGDARVADDSGIVYSTSDLKYNNSFAGAFDDLAFFGDLPIVLRGNTLVAYSNSFQETGRYTLSTQPQAMTVAGDTLYAFSTNSSNGIAVTTVRLALLTPAQPGQPVDPTGLRYIPDQIALGSDGIVYLLSSANLSIFRWSVAEQRYLATIPLAEAPRYMGYAAPTQRVYLAYPSGKITQIHLADELVERPFVNSPQSPCGLATADEFVFVCDPSGAWGSHFTYHPNGNLISQIDWNYYSSEYVWSAANRRMYFFRDDTSPNDLHWESINTQGVIDGEGETPYHNSAGIEHPIRVAPDGSVVVLGSGRIYNATTLEQIDALSNNIADAAWSTNLFSLRSVNGTTQIQKWSANYGVTQSKTLDGAPLRIFGLAGGLLTITNVGGVPTFSLWDTDLASPSILGLRATNNGPTTWGEATTLHATVAYSTAPATYTWDFGDGTSGEGATTTHVFAQPGSYTVTVTAHTANGTSTAQTQVLVVLRQYIPLAAR